MIFSQQKRSVIKEQNPSVTFGAIGKLLGEAWQKLSPDERKPYEELAKVAKDDYAKAMTKYKEEHPDSSEDERPRKRARKGKKKDKNAPKKPCSAFFWFSREKRSEFKAKNPDAGFGEMGKLIGSAWRQLSDDEKKPYNEKAAKDKERYQQEMSTYEKPKSESEEESSSSESESESGSGSSSGSSSGSESESS